MDPRRSIIRRFIAFLTAALISTMGGTAQAAAGQLTLLSLTPGGQPGNLFSSSPSISADGRFVAFESEATNLVEDDTNGVSDIFVRNLAASTTTRVSITGSGEQATGGGSFAPVVSANGRFVAFQSFATNLVSGDTNTKADIFLHDLQFHTTILISASEDGSPANGDSYAPAISADGRYVAFQSQASNLVNGDANQKADVFVRDVQTGQTVLVSATADGSSANGDSDVPSISADGRFVAFQSDASDLVEGDTNGKTDIFIRNLAEGTTVRVSVSTAGEEANDSSLLPILSPGARFVTYQSKASNLVEEDKNNQTDLFVYDRQAGTTRRLSVASDGSEGNATSYAPASINDSGIVVFASDASNLVSGDTNAQTDIFVHHLAAGTTSLISTGTGGSPANGFSFFPVLSADSRWVAFFSGASNLVSGDTNGQSDVFLYETGFDVTPPTVVSITRASASPSNAGNVSFTLTFSEAVTGVDADDFTLFTEGLSGASISQVSGSGASYTIVVSTGSGNGTLRVDVNASGTGIQDAAGNPLNAGFSSGEVYTIDKTPPTVVSVARSDANPTHAATVGFTVTFSEPVSGVDETDFTPNGGLSGASITGISGSGAIYNVTVSTGTGDGTLRLDVNASGTGIQDAAGNALSAGFTGGEAYTLDRTAPVVLSITRQALTLAGEVSFTVTFSEPVSGVDEADFTLSVLEGAFPGAEIHPITGSGATRTVTVKPGWGSGRFRLDINSDGTAIQDAAGNLLNGGFSGGEECTFDHLFLPLIRR